MSIYYDIIIIGSGMSGLYSAYNIKKKSPNTSFLILEKYQKQWLGGRTSNELFYGTEIVTGAGIGRNDTNPLLIHLLNELDLHYDKYLSIMDYSKMFHPVDIVKIIKILKSEYKKNPELHNLNFKQFFIKILGEELYKNFLVSAGYTDYENADIHETLYNYGMDDNQGGWTALHIPWKKMVHTLYYKIGVDHFKFSNSVNKITRVQKDPCRFLIETEKGSSYLCNKVIIATTITGIHKLLPNYKIYNDIKGQPFLRLYGKFSKESSKIMKQYIPNYTIVPGPLQKIIPMDANKGIYMIAYNDNVNTNILKNYLKNTHENRELYCRLIEEAIGIPYGSLKINAIKDFYWPIGTHYYTPLNRELYKNREDFVYQAQHPEKGILVVGEVVSRYQGWTEGAVESVKAVLNNKWIKSEC